MNNNIMMDVMNSLVDSVSKNNIEGGRQLVENIDLTNVNLISTKDERWTFSDSITMLTTYLISKEFKDVDSNHRLYIELELKSELLTHFFDQYFCKVEGSSCSHDKTCEVLEKLFIHFKTNKIQEFDKSYSQSAIETHPDLIDRIPHWAPQTISNTEEALTLFKNWYFVK